MNEIERARCAEVTPNRAWLGFVAEGRSHHLPGDLDAPGLQDVLAEEPTDYDVVLAPHHGSRRSNSPELARWSTPEWVVVSGSRRWDRASIRTVYEQTGAHMLHTAECGAVEVCIDATGVRVGGFLSGPERLSR